MRFLSLYKSVERGVPPSQEEMAKMGKLIEEGMKSGSNGKHTVTDGPFTESKEVIGGFAILEANSKEEAIELAKNFLQVVGVGECELRQIYEANTAAQSAAKS